MAAVPLAAGATVLGAVTGGKGASKAAKAQAEQQQRALAQQQAQFNQTRADNMPFLQAGQGALGGVQGLLGLQGADVQQAALDALRNSPAFTSQYDLGRDAVLQSAAATGGLRGGNTTNSLAQFGAGLFNQILQQQLGNLGGLVNIGAGTAGNLGSLGQANSNAQSQIYSNIGNANATRVAAPYAALQGLLNQIGGNARSGAGLLSGIPAAPEFNPQMSQTGFRW